MWYNYCGCHYIYCSWTVSGWWPFNLFWLLLCDNFFSISLFPFFRYFFIIATFIIDFHRRRSRKMQSLNQQKSPLPIAGLPVNCCGPNGSPGPLGSIATLSAFNHHKVIKNDSFNSRIGRYRKVKSTQL